PRMSLPLKIVWKLKHNATHVRHCISSSPPTAPLPSGRISPTKIGLWPVRQLGSTARPANRPAENFAGVNAHSANTVRDVGSVAHRVRHQSANREITRHRCASDVTHTR